MDYGASGQLKCGVFEHGISGFGQTRSRQQVRMERRGMLELRLLVKCPLLIDDELSVSFSVWFARSRY